MNTHTHARLMQKDRLRLVAQYLNDHLSLAEPVAGAVVYLGCASKCLARYRSGGAAALADRLSIRGTPRHGGKVVGIEKAKPRHRLSIPTRGGRWTSSSMPPLMVVVSSS